MILQSVPAEEEFPENASLYGRSTENDRGPSRHTHAKRAVGLKQKACDVIHEGSTGVSRHFACLSVFFFLAVLGVGASVALLRRLGNEASRFARRQGRLVAFFSYSPSTDAALAWLGAALLTGTQPDMAIESTLFARQGSNATRRFLPDGELVGIWQPPLGGPPQIRALVHGDVSGMLRRVHGFGPPQVVDLSQLGTGKHSRTAPGIVSEADAFLALRALLSETAEEDEHAKNEDAQRRLKEARDAELVLVSHPHHIPYLATLARASGFRPVGLDPILYSQVPWLDFGCSPLGYAIGMSPQEGVQRELDRLSSFAESLRTANEEHAGKLSNLLDAANMTLTFDLCITEQVAQGVGNMPSVTDC